MLGVNEIAAAKPAAVSRRKSSAPSRGCRGFDAKVCASRVLGRSRQRAARCKKRADEHLAAGGKFTTRALLGRRLGGRRFTSAINTRAIAHFLLRWVTRAKSSVLVSGSPFTLLAQAKQWRELKGLWLALTKEAFTRAESSPFAFTNHDSRVANHAIRGGTVNRPSTPSLFT